MHVGYRLGNVSTNTFIFASAFGCRSATQSRPALLSELQGHPETKANGSNVESFPNCVLFLQDTSTYLQKIAKWGCCCTAGPVGSPWLTPRGPPQGMPPGGVIWLGGSSRGRSRNRQRKSFTMGSGDIPGHPNTDSQMDPRARRRSTALQMLGS